MLIDRIGAEGSEVPIDVYFVWVLFLHVKQPPAFIWLNRLQKDKKTRPGLCREMPAWHTLLTHTSTKKKMSLHPKVTCLFCVFVSSNKSATSPLTEKERNGMTESIEERRQSLRSHRFLHRSKSAIAALLKPSMYPILHSTGVCVNCQSDFSGLKRKIHGISHLEGESCFKDRVNVFNGFSFYIKDEWCSVVKHVTFHVLWCQVGGKCNSSAQTLKEDLYSSYSSPAVRQQLNRTALIALKSYRRITECWQPHFMSFGLSLTEVVMSSPHLSALDFLSLSNCIMPPKFPHCPIYSKFFRSFVLFVSTYLTSTPRSQIDIVSYILSNEQLFNLQRMQFPCQVFNSFSASRAPDISHILFKGVVIAKWEKESPLTAILN